MAPATSRRQRRRIPQRGFPLRLRFSRWGRANETRHCLSRNTKYEKTEGIDPVTAAIAEREGDLDLWANRFFLPFLRSQNEEREKNGKRYSRLTSPFDCKGGRGRERGLGEKGAPTCDVCMQRIEVHNIQAMKSLSWMRTNRVGSNRQDNVWMSFALCHPKVSCEDKGIGARGGDGISHHRGTTHLRCRCHLLASSARFVFGK